MTEDGLFVEATNSVAKKWFRGIDELLVHDQLKHRMLSNLLMLAYVRPRGSVLFYEVLLIRKRWFDLPGRPFLTGV